MTTGNTTRREYAFERFTVDLDRARLLRDGAEVPLRPKAFDVLVYLIEHRSRLATKDELIAALWPNVVVTDDSLVKCIQEVRDALDDKERRYLKTVPRRGYIFEVPIAEKPATDPASPSEPSAATPVIEEAQPETLEPPALAAVSKSVRTPTRARWIALGALGAATIGGYYAWRTNERSVDSAAISAAEVDPLAADKSVAVLPFASIGADSAQDYFSDGISEELLHAVAALPGVRVPSRTSSFAFKGTNSDLRTIANALRVTHVLEGSVRKDGDRVRISAQLVDVATDSRVWSAIYERDLNDIFVVQDEIARNVAAALEVELLGASAGPARVARSANPDAYDAYLHGLHYMRTERSSDLRAAIDAFRRATRLDPQFAAGHAWLALALIVAQGYGVVDAAEAQRDAEAAVGTALALAPNLADAHNAKGSLALIRDDAATADADYRRAIALNPSFEFAYSGRMMALTRMSRLHEARAALERALELDPLNAHFNWDMGNALLSQGRPDDARAYFRRAVEFLPSQPNAYAGLGDASVLSGRIDEAVQRYLEGLEQDPGQPHITAIVGLAYRALDDSTRARQWFDRASSLLQLPALSRLFRDFDPLVFLAEDPDTLFALLPEIPSNQFVPFGSRLFRKAALRTGDEGRAEEFLRARWPDLFAADPELNGYNFGAASDVAWVLQRTGQAQQAETLLLRALDVARDPDLRPLTPVDWALPMFEVEALALLGRESEALDALRRVVDGGWRWDWWVVETDPTLSSISGHPRFRAMLDEVRADVAAQRERVRRLEENGSIALPEAPSSSEGSAPAPEG